MNTVQNYKNIQKSDYMDGFILNKTLLKTLIPIRASFPTHQFSTFRAGKLGAKPQLGSIFIDE